MLIDTSKSERLEHPLEKGQWVEIRYLTAGEMDEARDVRIKKVLDQWGDAIMGAKGGQRAVDDSIEIRAQAYDATVLLSYAITSWSYEAPVNPENVKRLDGATRDWLVEEVVKRNTRPLAKQKNFR